MCNKVQIYIYMDFSLPLEEPFPVWPPPLPISGYSGPSSHFTFVRPLLLFLRLGNDSVVLTVRTCCLSHRFHQRSSEHHIRCRKRPQNHLVLLTQKNNVMFVEQCVLDAVIFNDFLRMASGIFCPVSSTRILIIIIYTI